MRTIVAAVAILCACFMQEVSGDFAVSSAPVNEATLKKEAGSELMEETQGDEKIGDTDKNDEEDDDEDDEEDEEQDDDDDLLADRLMQDAEDEEQDDGKTLALVATDESDEKVGEEDEEQDGADSEDEEQEQDEDEEDDEEDQDEEQDEEKSQEMLQYIKKRVVQMSPSVQNLFAQVEELEKETDKDVVSEEAEADADKAHKEFGKTFAKESVKNVVSEEAEAAADVAHQEFGKAFAKELGHPADELAEQFVEDKEDQTDKYIEKRLASMSPSVNSLYAKVEKLTKENQKVEVSKEAQKAEDQAFTEFSKAFAKELGLPMKGLEATVRKLAMEDASSAPKK